jgi:hypothetical protein
MRGKAARAKHPSEGSNLGTRAFGCRSSRDTSQLSGVASSLLPKHALFAIAGGTPLARGVALEP